MNFSHLRALMLGNVWLLEEGYFHKARAVIERRISGVRLSAEDIIAIKYEGDVEANGRSRQWDIDKQEFSPATSAAAGGGGGSPAASQIAVINAFGMIMQHSSQVDNISGPGGTSCERLSQSLRAALADPSVKSIVFNYNSPGGGVYGIEALANEMFAARGQKPMVAQINSMCGSAAYWLATQADEIVVTPGGEVGSIGAYGLHEDKSKAAANAGVKYTFISAGKYKVEGNAFEPLSDEALAATQKKVDAYYGQFVNAVARGRGTTAKDVRGGMGQGRMELAGDALKLNMADRIATLDQTLTRYARMKPMAKDAKAAQAETITLQSAYPDGADGARVISLEGEFPALVLMSDDLVKAGMIGERASRIDEGSGDICISFELANASASYKFARRIDEFHCEYSRVPFRPARVKDAVDHELEAAATKHDDRLKADAFRRRRHAFRMRSMAIAED